jgi:hypothetical protein
MTNLFQDGQCVGYYCYRQYGKYIVLSVPVIEGRVQGDSDVDGMTLHLISLYTFKTDLISHNNVQII